MKTNNTSKLLSVSASKTAFLAILASAVLSPFASGQQVFLLTANDSGTYTSDGSNTWNPLTAARIDTENTSFTLADTSGSTAAGITWTVTRGNGRAEIFDTSNTTFPSLSWFDGSEAGQAESYRVQNGTQFGDAPAWTISGFNPTDVINVQWIASNTQSTKVRTLDAAINGTYGSGTILSGFSNVISGSAVSSNDFDTAQTTNYMEWNISPDAFGNLELAWSPGAGNNAYYTALTALRVEVVPEPSAFALIAGIMAAASLLRRRRV